MDRNTHRKILAQMYGCAENELLDKFNQAMPQIRNSAVVTLSIESERKVAREIRTAVLA